MFHSEQEQLPLFCHTNFQVKPKSTLETIPILSNSPKKLLLASTYVGLYGFKINVQWL